MGVSVLIASFNCKPYIKQCLDSVFSQDYDGEIEIIVCDDCSTDGSIEVLSEYEKQGKIKLIKNVKNLGAAQSRNNCLDIATQEFIAILDADDYVAENRLSRQVGVLLANSDLDFVSSGIQRFYENGEVKVSIPQKEFPQSEDFLFGLPFAHATTLFRREILRKVGGYRIAKETKRGQDYDLFMRIYAAGGRGCNIPDVLYFYRCFHGCRKKKKYRYRIDEAVIRYKGFKAMKLGIKSYAFILKPLILGLIPEVVIAKFFRR